jgi:outer membrane protein TolC
VNLSYDRVVNPLNTTKVAGTSSVTIPSTVLQTRYQQELSLGTSYAISFNLQRQVSTQAGLLYNPALSSFFAAQVYQPLLNGFGSALTRRFVTLAENDRAIVREAIHSTLNNTLANAANAYWDLIALRENVRAAEDAVATARREVDDDRQRVDLDVMTPLDLVAAESQLASTRVRLVTAQTRLQQQEVLIKNLISRTADPALDAAPIVPTDDLPGPSDIDVPPLDASLTGAMTNRSSIRQAELSLKNQRIAEEYTRKNLLPVFSVYAALNLFGLAPSTDPAIRQLLEWQRPEFSLGFTWSMPVLNRSAQADDIRARLERQEAEATLRRTRVQIQGQVQSATASLTQGRARVEASQRAVVTSRRVLEGARAKVEAGIATPYDVALAQRDVTAAEAADTQARVDYAKALVAHQLAVGGLLEKNGVTFEQALRGDLFIGAPR